MIAIESFKRFRSIDIIAIILLAFFSYIFDVLTSSIPSLQWSFILSVLTTTILMTFTVFLIRKAGSATMFYAARALLIYNLEGLGINTFFTLITAGIIFELIFLILKLEVKNVPIDIITSASVSNAVIPVMTGLLLSVSTVNLMLSEFFNLILLYLIIGVAGTVISFLIWYNVRLTKIIMKFEYAQVRF